MRSRQFIAGLGGAAAWPVMARAQQSERVRRVGVLTGLYQSSYQAFAATFREGLSKLGWVEGHNLMTELRFGAADADAIRNYAAELVSLAPDAIVHHYRAGDEGGAAANADHSNRFRGGR